MEVCVWVIGNTTSFYIRILSVCRFWCPKANEISHEYQGTNILPNKKTQLTLTVLSLNEGFIIYWSNHWPQNWIKWTLPCLENRLLSLTSDLILPVTLVGLTVCDQLFRHTYRSGNLTTSNKIPEAKRPPPRNCGKTQSQLLLHLFHV